MKYKLTFTLPGLPKTTNGQMSLSWRKKGNEARSWQRAVIFSVGAKKPPKPLEKARLTLTRVSSSCPDSDGLVSSFKPIIDGLRYAKVLLDDKFENIGMPTYLWEKGKQSKGRIQITVEEL